MEISHILMPYSGTHDDDDALKVVCRIAREFRAKLSLVNVIEVPLSYAVEAEDVPGLNAAQDTIERGEEIAADNGVHADTQVLKDREAGRAIVEHAKALGVSHIFIAASHPKRQKSCYFGDNTDYILRKAPCFVWVSRNPADVSG